jgi:hypothetical protein
MNDLEFRQQALDPISDSFCAAKWYNATIWLGSGQTTSCHHPPAHAIDAEAIKTNPISKIFIDFDSLSNIEIDGQTKTRLNKFINYTADEFKQIIKYLEHVVKLGKIATLLIILQAKEISKIKIEIRKKKLAKKIQ